METSQAREYEQSKMGNKKTWINKDGKKKMKKNKEHYEREKTERDLYFMKREKNTKSLVFTSTTSVP